MQNFLKITGISQKLLNQDQASLYSFECICHAESKYGKKIWISFFLNNTYPLYTTPT